MKLGKVIIFQRHKQEKFRIYGIYSDVAEIKLQIYKSCLTIQLNTYQSDMSAQAAT